jgi:hypothetical protein
LQGVGAEAAVIGDADLLMVDALARVVALGIGKGLNNTRSEQQ